MVKGIKFSADAKKCNVLSRYLRRLQVKAQDLKVAMLNWKKSFSSPVTNDGVTIN